MEDKIARILIRLSISTYNKLDETKLEPYVAELLALFTQSVEESQWKKRFMELKNYLAFQERMVETQHAGRINGDELVLLETINEHVEEIEESEY